LKIVSIGDADYSDWWISGNVRSGRRAEMEEMRCCFEETMAREMDVVYVGCLVSWHNKTYLPYEA
jgi:hypothetical protein